MSEPNTVFRTVRMSLRLSQDDMARLIREAGDRAGQPNDASKRLVQRWEDGTTRVPQAKYARALEQVTGLPIEALGFASGVPVGRISEDGQGGHDLDTPTASLAPQSPATGAQTAPQGARGAFSGVWLSRYEFVSSGRGGSVFTGLHHVLVLQHGNRLTARSLPGASSNPDSPLTLDLTADGNVVTGTWTEQTAADGYYRGARYHGAVQMLVEPTGRRMAGKWVGFGKDFDVNTGPWSLELLDSSTAKAAVERWSRPPEASVGR